jgi:hypothetical protein
MDLSEGGCERWRLIVDNIGHGDRSTRPGRIGGAPAARPRPLCRFIEQWQRFRDHALWGWDRRLNTWLRSFQRSGAVLATQATVAV